jgi:nucleoside-diphosphate-sugar epimerase
MKVLVTGGTGFLGSHIVLALLDAGHEVRLLVRRPEQVAATFAPHDVTIADVATGDVLDELAVARALEGCTGVVHAAAVFSFDPRRGKEMLTTNEQAARNVLGQADSRGCDPVVHISSTVALTRRAASNPELELGDVELPYSISKMRSEQVARDLQENGAPVVCVYPGGVYGPHDPYQGEQTRRISWQVRGLFPLWASGGIHIVDVRDVARVVAAAMQPGRGPQRYVVPGVHMTGRMLYDAINKAISRRRPMVLMPAPLAVVATRTVDAIQARLPEGWRYPADREGAELGMRNTVFDTSSTTADLGVVPIPFEQSIRDTIAWMVEDGRLPEKYRPS